jgi:hypothetical protein
MVTLRDNLLAAFVLGQQASEDLLTAERVCELLLGQISTAFGKLVWIASFRIGKSTEYSNALGQAVCPETASLVLCRSHERLFAQWIGSKLETQYKLLSEYFDGQDGVTWPALDTLVPSSAHPAERALFIADVDLLCNLLAIETSLTRNPVCAEGYCGSGPRTGPD